MARDEAYRKAEQKIEEARQSEAKTLNLIGMDLTELPESLGQLTQLQSLNLPNNRLTVLPEWLGQLTQLQALDLRYNRLTGLPEWLGQLSQLQLLLLSSNQLMALPGSIGQLTQLRSLHLFNNLLTELPESLGQLTQLEELDVAKNKLKRLPESISRLGTLERLWLGGDVPSLGRSRVLWKVEHLRQRKDTVRIDLPTKPSDRGGVEGDNRLETVPQSIRHLKKLTVLALDRCSLTSLPAWLGELRSLETLTAYHNSIRDIPTSLRFLSQLRTLGVYGNYLDPELVSILREGLDAIRRYLEELAKGAKKRYEAKLLILGDGNEGKTCVSRALRDLPFREQRTTHGVDVAQWKFAHPDYDADREKDLTLNIWDFEGQEISHQTHQFFLTSQSLYLLVFKCRDQFLLDRAEYWLDTIRARAPKAKVAIVISQCEGRMPLVPVDRIQAQYSNLLAKEWFFPVGCQDGSNIPKLKTFLRRWAADLEFMGSLWPVSYEKAETALKAKAKRGTARITRDKLCAAFQKAGVSKDGYEDAAAAMARLGVITQFPDCPDLRDFVVLRPQWLTKAISKVMEDKQLSADQGEIALQRMEAMWKKDYPGMFATFHDCMKEFELCYDLEDHAHSCLVPLRFGYVRPAIPWSDTAGMKVRRVEYKLNIRPPLGIMSRFIVKTHHMIVKTAEKPKGVYWHNGVFLRSGEGPLCSEALCEFVPEERKLCIEVRAAYPQNMCEQIHAYVKAVFSFFSGLEAERSYGCIKVEASTGAEERCSGVHTEKRIYSALSKQRVLDCEFEGHDIDPQKLIWGFSSFSEFILTKMDIRAIVRQENDKEPTWATPFLRGVGSLLGWVNANGGKLDELLKGQAALSAEFKQEAELKLQEYLALTSQMLDDRDFTAAPGLIAVRTKDRSAWNPADYFKQAYVLVPYCECERKIHACEDGHVEFTKDKAWWQATAPWIARSTKLLAAGLQLAFAGMPMALGAEVAKAVEDEVKFMDELTKHMELEVPKEQKEAGTKVIEEATFGKDLRGTDQDAAATRAALARFLEETAPNNYRARRWGSLRRVRMPDNSHRWLCEECAKQAR